MLAIDALTMKDTFSASKSIRVIKVLTLLIQEKHLSGICFWKAHPSCSYQQNNKQYRSLYAAFY